MELRIVSTEVVSLSNSAVSLIVVAAGSDLEYSWSLASAGPNERVHRTFAKQLSTDL